MSFVNNNHVLPKVEPESDPIVDLTHENEMEAQDDKSLTQYLIAKANYHNNGNDPLQHQPQHEAPVFTYGVATYPAARGKMSVEERLGLKPKPKRPMSAFFRFTNNIIRPRVMKENPNTPVTDVTKIASAEWKAADQSVKDRLNEEYKVDIVKYQQELKEYEKYLTPNIRQEIMRVKMKTKGVMEKKALKKKKEELGCPRKPPSSYMQFLQIRSAKRDPDMPYKDWMAQMSKEWETLDADSKQQLAAQHARDMVEYKTKMQAWEDEMRRLGYGDVVRRH